MRNLVAVAFERSGDSSAESSPPIAASHESLFFKEFLGGVKTCPESRAEAKAAATAAADSDESWPFDRDGTAAPFDPGATRRFYNRQSEFGCLNQLIQEEPEHPILLLGPRNCGNTVGCCCYLTCKIIVHPLIVVLILVLVNSGMHK